jgi:hypothetical protein
MRRFTRCLAALAFATAGLFAAQQQPAGAVAQAVVIGGGSMGGASGPGLTSTAVSGTVSGTIVSTAFGNCTFASDPFVGQESLIAGNGGGTMCGGFCNFAYQRVVHEIAINGVCSGYSVSFQAGGFAEPSSFLPTTSYLFQVTGITTPAGSITIEGSLSFSPGTVVGVDPGNVTQASTGVNFAGTMTGLLGGAIGTCSFNMTGGGNESLLLGQSSVGGPCNGPGIYDTCFVNWTHVGAQTVLNGGCGGNFGFTLVGVGELVMSGHNFTFVGEVTII